MSSALVSFRAPTRLDFGGGWTDVPPYDITDGGFVCNVAISRYATVTVLGESANREQPEGLLAAVARKYAVAVGRLSLHSDFPVAAGLGGSSAASVAAIAAARHLRGDPIDRSVIAEASRALEVEEMGIAGGRQDHYAAAFGGALGLTFTDRTTVERIPLSGSVASELARRCVVVYTGESRISAATITAVMDAYKAREPRVLGALQSMCAGARAMASALKNGDIDALGSLVGEQWVHQRSLHPAIPTPLIDRIIAAGKAAGAIGSKALGASGGGCVLLVAAEDRVEAVRKAVAELGALVDYSIDVDGLVSLSGSAHAGMD